MKPVIWWVFIFVSLYLIIVICSVLRNKKDKEDKKKVNKNDVKETNGGLLYESFYTSNINLSYNAHTGPNNVLILEFNNDGEIRDTNTNIVTNYDDSNIEDLLDVSYSTSLSNIIYLRRTNHNSNVILSALQTSIYTLQRESVQILSISVDSTTGGGSFQIFLKTDGYLYDKNSTQLQLSFANYNERVMQIDYCGNSNKIWILSNYHIVYKCSLTTTGSVTIESIYSNSSLEEEDTIVSIRGDVLNDTFPLAITAKGRLLLSNNVRAGTNVVDVVRDDSNYVYTEMPIETTSPKRFFYNQYRITLSSTPTISRVFAMSGNLIFANDNSHKFKTIKIDNDPGASTNYSFSIVTDTSSTTRINNVCAVEVLHSAIIPPRSVKIAVLGELSVSCPVNHVIDPNDRTQCSNCPYYQKRYSGEQNCTPLECSFQLNSNNCYTSGTNCDTDMLPSYTSLPSPEIFSNNVGFSNVDHRGTGLSFNTADNNCVGYVYASNNANDRLLMYPGVSNAADVIPASAHIHYNHICFENSNLVNNHSIDGCEIHGQPVSGTITSGTNDERDPHCPYGQKVVVGTDNYKTCRDISCWISFKGDGCRDTNYVCGQIFSSNVPVLSTDTGTGDYANLYSVSGTDHINPNNASLSGYEYHDWNLVTTSNNNIQLVTNNVNDSPNCGVFGYSHPWFNGLSNSNSSLGGEAANSWGSNVVLSSGSTYRGVGGDLGRYLSSVCFYDPSRPDSSNMCAHTQSTNATKVYMGGMPTCPSGKEPTGIDGRCQDCPIGTYKDTYNDYNMCTPCPVGTMSSAAGSSSCTECSGATISSSAGSSSCSSCPVNEIPNANKSACIPCDRGMGRTGTATACTPLLCETPATIEYLYNNNNNWQSAGSFFITEQDYNYNRSIICDSPADCGNDHHLKHYCDNNECFFSVLLFSSPKYKSCDSKTHRYYFN
jgi:hypothetical protein